MYKLIAKKNKYVAIFVAAALAPLCNTGVFAIGAFLMLDSILPALGDPSLSSASPAYVVFVLLIGINFFVELAINLVLAPAVYTVNNVVEKRISLRKKTAQ